MCVRIVNVYDGEGMGEMRCPVKCARPVAVVLSVVAVGDGVMG